MHRFLHMNASGPRPGHLKALFAAIALLALWCAPAAALAAGIPQPADQAIGNLLDLSTHRNGALNQTDVANLVDYVTKLTDTKDVTPARRLDANGAVLRVNLKSPLSRIMRYCYNPAIPSHVVFPSVLRLSGWYPGSDLADKEPKPWTLLGKLDKPVTLWGTEYEVNAPDSFGGGYYRYDMHRLLILTKFNGKNVLISVSKQKDKSSVGKKAVILDDGEWSYFYSGINGLNKGLIGWADTFLYDSASVQVFVEEGPNQTSLTLFKWLRAGWAGMNVVMKEHILEGSGRFATAFKRIVESDKLPDADEFAARVREFNAMSDAELDRRIAGYAQAIEQIAKHTPAMDKSEFQRIVEGGKYAKILSREERIGIMVVEYLKSRLGKHPLVEFPPPVAAAAKPKV